MVSEPNIGGMSFHRFQSGLSDFESLSQFSAVFYFHIEKNFGLAFKFQVDDYVIIIFHLLCHLHHGNVQCG